MKHVETHDTMTFFARKFPRALHAKIKAQAALDDVSLQHWIAEAAREKLEREEGKDGGK